MVYRIAIVTAYFGKLPQYFPLWLESCSWNDSIDFVLYTNDKIEYPYPANVHVHYCNFDDIRERVQAKFSFTISLEEPYKLCDFKVAFGEIFEDDLREFDFWGHCDLDQIMGSLRTYLTNDRLEKNDRIYQHGHLTVYRNIKKINSLYRKSKKYGWKKCEDILSSTIDYAFDEVGMRTILKNCPWVRQYSVMEGVDMAWNRFYCERMIQAPLHINTKNQIFYWQNGHTYQCCYDSDGNRTQIEVAYIHFGHKNPRYNNNMDELRSKGFFIATHEFVPKPDVDIPSVSQVKQYNPYPGAVKHLIENVWVEWKWTYWRRIKRKYKIFLNNLLF